MILDSRLLWRASRTAIFAAIIITRAMNGSAGADPMVMPLTVVSLYKGQSGSVGVFQHEQVIDKNTTSFTFGFQFVDQRTVPNGSQIDPDALVRSLVVESSDQNGLNPRREKFTATIN